MACRRIVKLRRGLLLWPLVGPTRATARRASVSSTEVSANRILGSNAYSHCQPVAVENREAIRTTSMMDDCNARALTPTRKSSIAVLSSRLRPNTKSRQWSQRRLLPGFDLAPIQTPFGQRRVSTSDSPVSSRLLRLARIIGQPFDVASMNFEPGFSISWMTVSLTVSPCCSSSYVMRE
jgi:hypothetical protein